MRLEDCDLQVGDLAWMPSLRGWEWECTPLIFIGVRDEIYRVYEFMLLSGRIQRFGGSVTCEVLSRVAEALG